uniref:mitochondrial carrier homolog 2-like n=1 Tax=Myxine glutinosa TaxID=7769 RepID=UPI00358F6420
MAEQWQQYALTAGFTALSHPTLYVKVLMQVGYEPIAPVLGHNLFFRQELQLAGFFSYAKYIAKQDGQFGLFRGLTPRLCSALLALFTHHKVLKAYTEEEHLLEDEEEESTEEAFHPPVMQAKASKTMNDVIRETSHEMAARCAATVISYPFHVITVRCMVQFIGKEIKYSGLFGSFGTIYREEGLKGFFVGLIPRVMGDIISLWLCNLVTHIINTHVINNRHQYREMKSYTQAVTSCFTSVVVYPFVLVANLMAVNDCGITGGLPPYAPHFSSWLDCWQHMANAKQLKRGSSLFFRKVPIVRK